MRSWAPIGDETWNIETAYGESVGGWQPLTGDRVQTTTIINMVADRLTGPIVLLAPELGRTYVFADKPYDGVYVWQSPLDGCAFDATEALTWTVDPDTHVSDPTSTAQPVTLRSGTVVVSSSGQHNEYWQNERRT
jgi:hypothetical protein